MPRCSIVVLSAVLITSLASGCRSTPKARRTGYLSDYSSLEQVNKDLWFYRDPRFLKEDYPFVILDPVAIDLEDENERQFSDKEIREVLAYTKAAMTEALSNHFLFAQAPGPGVARLRLSLTGLLKSDPGGSVLPVKRLVGAGRGGAAVEAELVDSETGAQIIVAIRSTTGGEYFSTSGYSGLSDIKAAADAWAEGVDMRMREWKAER